MREGLLSVARHAASNLRRRAALGLRPVTAPVVVFIPVGFALGPGGLGLLSHGALAYLDVVVSIALATLGVFIGLAAGAETRHVRRLFAASTAEAFVTVGIVSAAMLVLLRAWNVPLALPHGVVAVTLGICAAASAAPHVERGGDRVREIAARVADLDDILPIVLGGLVIAITSTAGPPLAGAAITVLLGLAVALSGWLLFERRQDEAERGLFVLGSITLLGGTAAYLGLSPILTGLCAGWLWVFAPGHTDFVVARELHKVQHPLVVLLLITAGASLEYSTAGFWLLGPYVAFRLTGKLIGGWTASRIAAGIAPSDLGAYLVPPGVIGIAFALNISQVAPAVSGPLVFAVGLGAVASEILAMALTPVPER
jgi:hypothetical protein